MADLKGLIRGAEPRGPIREGRSGAAEPRGAEPSGLIWKGLIRGADPMEPVREG